MIRKITLLFISLCALTVQAQTWSALHAYQTQDAVWDKAKVDVSAGNAIIVSFQTKNSGRPALISTDNGTSWDTLMNSYQREFIGFDSNENLYIATAKKTPNVSTTYSDSLYYSANLGVTLQNLGDLPDHGFDPSSYYIDGDDNLYTLSGTAGANLTVQLQLFKNGQATSTLSTPFASGGNSLRGIIKLSGGNYVFSTYNSGAFWSSDGGVNWTESQNDSKLGTSTYTDFEEANNGDLFLAGVKLRICTDGGETWASSNLSTNFVYEVEKAGNGTLYAVSQFSGIYESLDNGATWAAITNLPSTSYGDIAVSDQYFYLVANDTLWQTAVSGSTSGLFEGSIQHSALKVYPNPTAGEINVLNENFDGTAWTIRIYDQVGREVLTEKAYTDVWQINRQELAAGTFIISILNENMEPVNQTRFIKIR